MKQTRKPMRLGGVMAAGLLAVGLAACSSSESTLMPVFAPPYEAMPPFDPCIMVTQDEASEFFGAPSNPGTPSAAMAGGDETASCIYTTEDNTGSLTLTLDYYTEGAVNSGEYTSLKAAGEVVPGLDYADGFYIAEGHLLYGVKGPWLAHMSGTIGSSPAEVPGLFPLMDKVLSKLTFPLN